MIGSREASMIIILEGALPCAQLEDQPGGSARHCRLSANTGIITPVEDGVWELLPVCQRHVQKAAHDGGECVARPSIELRKHSTFA
jgi:hypothetical protein